MLMNILENFFIHLKIYFINYQKNNKIFGKLLNNLSKKICSFGNVLVILHSQNKICYWLYLFTSEKKCLYF